MIDKNRHIDIMGIINLTDDSYFSQSRCSDVDTALRRVEKMLEEGADIIDIGACSTRPGARPVGAQQEWERIGPVLRALCRTYPEARISIDTYWSQVVRQAYDLIGDFVVNDISAGEDDPEMLPLVGQLGLPYVAMHKRGNPETMQSLTGYDDVVSEVLAFFNDFAVKAETYGIREWILDPGFGFAKTVEQNYQLLRALDTFRTCGRPVLVGVSRKSMIYRFLDICPEDALPATQVLHFKALQCGADILRVHDVAEAVRTVKLYKEL